MKNHGSPTLQPGVDSSRNTLLIGTATEVRHCINNLSDAYRRTLHWIGWLNHHPIELPHQDIPNVVHLGDTTQLQDIVLKFDVQVVLLASSSLPTRATLRRWLQFQYQEHFKILTHSPTPQLTSNHLQPHAPLTFRPLCLEDLLPCAFEEVDNHRINQHFCRRTVLITGAGGSIGSALALRLLAYQPLQILLLDHAENALFSSYHNLRSHNEQGIINITPILADITQPWRLKQVFAEYDIDIVLHAAAHKHVPLMELNPAAALYNNVWGTIALATTCAQYGIPHMLMVSTDKAIDPVGVMGASKRCAELCLESLSITFPDTCFSAIRLANVLGSSGSVVEIFATQLLNGHPLTVTDKQMQRYFMSLKQTTDLILQATVLQQRGEVLIPKLHSPILIVDLADDMIALQSYHGGEKASIVFTGIRPGEKMQEQVGANEHLQPTSHPSLLRIQPSVSIDAAFVQHISHRFSGPNMPDNSQSKALLCHWVRQYRPQRDMQPKRQIVGEPPNPTPTYV